MHCRVLLARSSSQSTVQNALSFYTRWADKVWVPSFYVLKYPWPMSDNIIITITYRTDQSMAVSQFHMRQSFAEDWGFHRDSLATVGVCHNTLWVSTNQTVFVEVQCNTAASAIIYEFHSKFCTLGTYTSICRQDNLCGSILSLHGGRSGLEVQEEDYS